MSLTPEDIRALVDAFEASNWDELSLQYGDTRLDLSRHGRPPQGSPASAPPSAPAVAAAPAAPGPTPSSAAAPSASSAPMTSAVPARGGESPQIAGHRVTSPSLGLFWRSPQPGAPPFVEVGQRVDAEDTVCIVEVMKLMNHVKAGVSGTVVAIEVENGAMVEFAAPLVIIEPED